MLLFVDKCLSVSVEVIEVWLVVDLTPHHLSFHSIFKLLRSCIVCSIALLTLATCRFTVLDLRYTILWRDFISIDLCKPLMLLLTVYFCHIPSSVAGSSREAAILSTVHVFIF